MEQTLRGAKLEGVDAVIRMEVTDGGHVASWDVISGKTSGGELLFGGRLSIEGDESKVVSLVGHLDREHQPF
jgi:hypothetical protein